MVFFYMTMYAIVATGGKQYKVSPGTVLDVERLKGAAGDQMALESVMAVGGEQGFKVGRPLLSEVSVTAEIVRQLKGPKVISFKFKRRKGYHRKVGHRQFLTRLKVSEIKFNGA